MTGPDVTEDRILGGRLLVRQPREGFRIAIDSVFLAAAVPVGAGESVLDLGCGVGGAALCLLAREPEAQVTGIEIQRELAALASQNAKLNGVERRFIPLQGDLREPPPRIAPGGYDHVMANPPYLEEGKASVSPKAGRRITDMESEAGLADWVRAALLFLRDGGSLTIIQRADRLGGILSALEDRAGSIVVFPLWPGSGKPAKRVIVQARKHKGGAFRLSRGLTLHEAAGGYSAQAEAILREAAALKLGGA